MKKSMLFLFLLCALSGAAQNNSHYKKVYDYGVYTKDWAMVKTIAGTYGFIDRNKKEIVPAIYSKIYKPDSSNSNYIMVESVANAYGFIDKNGKEVVKTHYFKKEEAIQKLSEL